MEGIEVDEIPELLARLVDKSLVQIDADGRYSLLQLVRAYGQEELMRSEDNHRTRARHSSYYGHMCEYPETIESGTLPALVAQLTKELENIRHAAEWATSDPKTWPRAVRILGDMFGVMHTRGTYEDGLAMGRAVIESAPADSDFALAAAWAWVAVIHEFQSSPKAAESCQTAIDLAEKSGNKSAMARALLQRATDYWRTGRHAEANELGKRSLALARELKETRQLGPILVSLGNAALFEGKLDEAKTYYEQCRTVWESVGDERGSAVIKGNLGHIQERLGDYKTAYQYARSALTPLLALQDVRNLAGIVAAACSGFWVAKDYETMAMLLGCADGLWEKGEAYPDGVDEQTANKWRARVTAKVGEATYEAAHNRGKKMPLKDVVEKVMENPEPWAKKWKGHD